MLAVVGLILAIVDRRGHLWPVIGLVACAAELLGALRILLG